MGGATDEYASAPSVEEIFIPTPLSDLGFTDYRLRIAREGLTYTG